MADKKMENKENQAPIEGEGKVVDEKKANKEKFLVRAGRKFKKIASSKPVKILGRTLVVAGSALGVAAFIRSENSNNQVTLDVLDTPQFPDTQMAEIPAIKTVNDPKE